MANQTQDAAMESQTEHESVVMKEVEPNICW